MIEGRNCAHCGWPFANDDPSLGSSAPCRDCAIGKAEEAAKRGGFRPLSKGQKATINRMRKMMGNSEQTLYRCHLCRDTGFILDPDKCDLGYDHERSRRCLCGVLDRRHAETRTSKEAPRPDYTNPFGG